MRKPGHEDASLLTLFGITNRRALTCFCCGMELKDVYISLHTYMVLPISSLPEDGCFVSSYDTASKEKSRLTNSLYLFEEGIHEFCWKLKGHIGNKGLIMGQIYNTDETGLFHHFTPDNLENEKINKLPGTQSKV